MRTIVADRCGKFFQTPSYTTGVLYYEGTNNSKPPDTKQAHFPTACADEPYESLVPCIPWTIGKPNNPRTSKLTTRSVSCSPLIICRGWQLLGSRYRPTVQQRHCLATSWEFFTLGTRFTALVAEFQRPDRHTYAERLVQPTAAVCRRPSKRPRVDLSSHYEHRATVQQYQPQLRPRRSSSTLPLKRTNFALKTNAY